MSFIPLLVKNCPKNMPKSFGCEFEVVYLLSMLWNGNNAIYYYREIVRSISASAIQYCYDFLMAFIPLLVKNCPKNMPKSFGCKFEFVYLFSMLWSGRHAIYYYQEIERSISASAIQLDGIYTPVGEKLSKQYVQDIWLRIWSCIFAQYAMMRQTRCRYILLSRNWAIHFGFRYST